MHGIKITGKFTKNKRPVYRYSRKILCKTILTQKKFFFNKIRKKE